MRVEKVWGHEEWLVNEGFCCKRLVVRAGAKCSWHYHPKKDELFLVASGMVRIKYLHISKRNRMLGEGHSDEEIYRLAPFVHRGPWQHFRVRPGLLHQFEALASDAELIESSTFHSDDDVIRLLPSEAPCVSTVSPAAAPSR